MGWHLGCIMKMLGRAQQRNDGCGGSFCVVLSYCTVHTTVYSTVLYVLYYQRLARTTCLLDGWSQMDVTKEQSVFSGGRELSYNWKLRGRWAGGPTWDRCVFVKR